MLKDITRRTPAGRIARPEDIADVVLFLASDESKFITAHEIAPDAGVTEF